MEELIHPVKYSLTSKPLLVPELLLKEQLIEDDKELLLKIILNIQILPSLRKG